MKLSPVLPLLLLFFVPAVRAEIAWETKELVFHPTLDDKDVTGEFKFTNKGTEVVTILSAEPGCDCLSHELDNGKKVYQPGESGTLRCKFNCGTRTGLKQKTIVVTSDDKKEPKTQLSMRLYLPESPTITPTFVYWSTKESPSTKTVSIKIGDDCPFHKFPEIKVNDSRVHAELKTVKDAKEYLLTVAVDKTREEFNGYVDLISDVPVDNPRKFRVHACVMNDK